MGRLHRVAQELTRQLTRVYADYGLSEGEFDVLCALRRQGHPYALQPSELARSTMVTTGGLTKRLDRLAEAGLVTRLRAESGDGRAKTVRLTEAGLTLIDRAFTAHMANEARIVAELPSADREALEVILHTWALALDL